jgi:hypothetical protein
MCLIWLLLLPLRLVFGLLRGLLIIPIAILFGYLLGRRA